MYDHQSIEKKWQKKWDKEKCFEPEVDPKQKKFYVSWPYPYVNFSPHVGHLFTMMRTEAFARYKRSQGYNVLLPQGWHCTGTPVWSCAQRVKEREKKILGQLEKEGFTEKDWPAFEDPLHWIETFRERWKDALQSLGGSIDWRRSFMTTSLNPHYDKFVRWQFHKLKEKGYVAKGKHPVVWDPKTNMPVGDHDRTQGEGETPKDFIWAKFRMKDSGLILMAGTTRPDALLGQTNLWIDPKGTYVVVAIGDEQWVVGEAALDKIENHTGKRPKILQTITPKELIGKWVQGPLVNYPLYILPANFIDANVGSGLVYSALEDPVDLIELRNMQKDDAVVKKYNLDAAVVNKLKPIPIIDIEGMGDDLGDSIAAEFKITNPQQKEKLEEAKCELNRRVFRKGLMKKSCGKYAGMTVPDAQEIIKKELIEQKEGVMFYELTGKVVSRSLTECVVKIVSDQWFITYSNPEWKAQVHKALKDIKLYPDLPREQFSYVIDWLNDWACAREYGLGTRLPFDEKWLIESLSDSTIYMAYFTISHILKDVPSEEIDDAFFDYVFLGKGTAPKVKNIEQMRKEFMYWYPHDFRNSGKDLIQNHLTFFLFNHIAIFPKEHWPKGIGTNGWVRVDGEKMSKSLGNVIPLSKMTDEFGADASRLTILNGGELLDDPNWDSRFAENVGKKFEQFLDFANQYNKGSSEKNQIDIWMEHRLAQHVAEATAHMEETLFRSAIQKIYFDLVADLRWYMRRAEKPNKAVFNTILEAFAVMMQPFTPHLAEELWETIGKKTIISAEHWPQLKATKFEDTEAHIKQLLQDVRRLLQLVKKQPKKVTIYAVPKEAPLFQEAQAFLEKELKLAVTIFANNEKNIEDPMEKAAKAKPGKPSLYLE